LIWKDLIGNETDESFELFKKKINFFIFIILLFYKNIYFLILFYFYNKNSFMFFLDNIDNKYEFKKKSRNKI
jgi:hypothetical protein